MKSLTKRMGARLFRLGVMLALSASIGCASTMYSDTSRTGTEQLLLSTAIDESVSKIDFALLSGKTVYLDSTYLDETVDKQYLLSRVRQQLIFQGCLVKEKLADAQYVVEPRAGTVGTDRSDRIVGIPATSFSLPTGAEAGVPTMLPEIAVSKTTNQSAVAKIACFAYNRETGQAVWQSGVVPVAVNAKHTWIVGAGPWRRGSLYEGTQFIPASVDNPNDARE